MQRNRRTLNVEPGATSMLLVSVCVVLVGCSQTPRSEQANILKIEQAKALRAEQEAGCAAQGFTPGTPDFQSCVGRASIPHANAGVSRGKLIHQGVKHRNEALQLANTGLKLARVATVVSDSRVKENLVPVGKLNNGIRLYRFNYKGGQQLAAAVNRSL